LPEDERRLAKVKRRISYDVDGGFEVGDEKAEQRVEPIGEAHRHLLRHYEGGLVRVVDEDSISESEVFDVRASVEDVPDGSVTVFDREGKATGEGGQVEREVGRDLTAIDEHLGPLAQGRSNRPYAHLARGGGLHLLQTELRRARRAKPEGACLQRTVRYRRRFNAHRVPSGYSTRLSRIMSLP
jgi:hypothetical protein